MANANRMDVPEGTKQLIDAKLKSGKRGKKREKKSRKEVFEGDDDDDDEDDDSMERRV